MRVNFEWLGVEKDEGVEEWAEEQLSKIDKYLGKFDEDFRQGWVRVTKENGFTYKVSLEMRLPTKKEFFVEVGEDLRSCFSLLSDKAERWTRKHLDKLEESRS